MSTISLLSTDLGLAEDEDYSDRLHLHHLTAREAVVGPQQLALLSYLSLGENELWSFFFFQKYIPNHIHLCYLQYFKASSYKNYNKQVIQNLQTLTWHKKIHFSKSYQTFVPFLPYWTFLRSYLRSAMLKKSAIENVNK